MVAAVPTTTSGTTPSPFAAGVGHAEKGHLGTSSKRPGFFRRRICCCSVYTCICVTILLILVIIGILIGVAFAVYKQPSVKVMGVIPPAAGALPVFQPDPNTIAVNMTLKISVENPNPIGVTLTRIVGRGYSDALGKGTPIANAEITDVVIAAKATTDVLVPFTALYGDAIDPEQKAIRDLLTRCGLVGGQKSKIPLQYEVDVYLWVGFASIGLPTFKGSTSFDCPIPAGTSLQKLDQLIAKFKA